MKKLIVGVIALCLCAAELVRAIVIPTAVNHQTIRPVSPLR